MVKSNEWKEIGKKLESEEKYEMLFNSIDEGFCIIEVIFDDNNKPIDYRFLEINPAFERQTGLYEAEGKLMRDLRPKHEEHWFQIYGEIALTGKSMRFENPAKELNRYYDVYAFKIGGPESRKVAILFNDITERKKAEYALNESEDLYRTLFENTKEGFQINKIIFDESGNPCDYVVLKVNKAYELQTGLKRSDVVGKQIKEIFPDIEPYWISKYGNVAKTGKEARFENYNKNTNRWYEARAFLCNKGQVGVLFKDITKRKKAEEGLKKEEHFISAVTNTSPAIIYVYDLETRSNVFANDGIQRIMGYSQKDVQEMGSRLFATMVHPDDLQELEAFQRKVLEASDGIILENEHRAKHKDGTWLWLHTWESPFLRNVDGSLKQKVGVAIDITELKQMEKKLQETINELKRSNKELQQFAYVSSHDLQEPLRTIASFTQLLAKRYKSKLDSDADEFMDYIVDASVRMKQQIQDLLEYSRVATQTEEFELVNMNLILNQTIQSLNTSIEEFKAEIIVDELPYVIGDAGQLQRVFQNLIANAIKFRKPEKSPIIHISSYKDEDNHEYMFSVKDNGIGIEEQYLERIFTIFQRLHTIEEYHGTGIGLSIVKRIIEQHGGRIWVESEFGVGSTFHFTLPKP